MSFSFFSGSKHIGIYNGVVYLLLVAAPCYHLSLLQSKTCLLQSIQNDLTVWLHLLVDASLTTSSANLNWIPIRICCSKKGMTFSCVLYLIISLE